MINFLGCISGAVTTLFGYYFGRRAIKEDLVEQGYAEYYIDRNNKKAWRIKITE